MRDRFARGFGERVVFGVDFSAGECGLPGVRAQCCGAHEQKHVQVGAHVLGAAVKFADGGRVIEHTEENQHGGLLAEGAGGGAAQQGLDVEFHAAFYQRC